MRLTLRTLLAWLDDTLKPTQVREIGVQVAGSTFAQELSDRIHRVTRQRRLSVPSSSGPDATDPNMVASYLDNELDPDAVAEYEKKCLTSDVNLAEVASVHQILSLLGQKVKVPAAARARMYQLVKGRENSRSIKLQSRRSEALEPVTKPIQPWVLPEVPRRSWIQRFGLGVLCLLLIGLSSASAWWSLTAPPLEAFRAFPMVANPDKGRTVPPAASARANESRAPISVDSSRVADGEDATEVSRQPRLAGPGGPDSAREPLKPEVGAAKVADATDPTSKSKDSSVVRSTPSGSAGLADAPDGILLRYNPDQRAWERLTGPTPLATSSRILCLAPFRAQIVVGKVQIVLIGESEVRILPESTVAAPALELVQGRLLLPYQPTSSLAVGYSNRTVTLETSPNSSVALERVVRRDYGRIMTPTPSLVIYCIKGEPSVTIDKKPQSLAALDVLALDGGGAKRSTEEALPAWASDAEPSRQELELRDHFARLIHPNRPVLAEIVAAVEDPNPDIRRLAIRALKSLGDMSLLMPMLSRKGDPIVRRSALAAVQSYMGLGPEAASRVRDQLVEEFGEETASFVGKMLIGFSPEEASSSQVYEQLVALLSPEQESIGVRELALDTLKRLTGRDDLGYDPDHPEGKGLNAWKDLQRQGKLRFTAPRTKVK